MVTITEEAFTM